jgi:hypothetical protein
MSLLYGSLFVICFHSLRPIGHLFSNYGLQTICGLHNSKDGCHSGLKFWNEIPYEYDTEIPKPDMR